MSYAVWPSAETWLGARTWDRTRVTCGAPGDVARRRLDGRLPLGGPGREGVGGVDEHERRGLDAELVLEQLLRAGRLEIVEDEPAGRERRRRPGRERNGGQQHAPPTPPTIHQRRRTAKRPRRVEAERRA